MKTYILYPPNTVEAQRAQFIESLDPQNLPHPQTPTSLACVSSRGSSPRALFIGLDVHNDSIAVSLAPSDSTEVRRYGIIGGSHDDVLKLVRAVVKRVSDELLPDHRAKNRHADQRDEKLGG